MKKIIIFSSLACILFIACGDSENKKSEAPLQTEQPTKNADSLKPAVDKKTQDSIDAAHGHSH